MRLVVISTQRGNKRGQMVKLLRMQAAQHHTLQWMLSNKNFEAEVLNLLSILEVAEYLSNMCVFHRSLQEN